MADQLTPFPQVPWRQDEPEHELPRRILVQIEQDRFAIDLTASFTVTRLRPTTGPIIPLRKADRKKLTGKLQEIPRQIDPRDHHEVEGAGSVPAAQPTDAPAIDMVAEGGWPGVSFRVACVFVHTCMAQTGATVNTGFATPARG
jgi:hypothetical protein